MSREKILKTAVKLFSEKGFNGVSVDELAKKSKVNKSTLYYHFKTKQEIFDKVIDFKIGDLLDKLNNNIYDDLTKEQKLKKFIEIIANREIELVRLMEREILDGSKNIQERNLKTIFNVYSILEKIVLEFKTDIKVGFILDLILGSSNLEIISHSLKKRVLENVDNEIDILGREEFINQLYETVIKIIRKEK